jgi:hypothetical protein
MPQRQTWREYIRGRQNRQTLRPHIKICKHQRQQKPSKENSRALQRRQREDFHGMRAILRIERNHQHLCATSIPASAQYTPRFNTVSVMKFATTRTATGNSRFLLTFQHRRDI